MVLTKVKDLKTILSEPPDSDDDPPPIPMPQDASLCHGFIFGFSSSNIDLTALHPPRELASRIWAMFKANVDPLVKILHLPTMEPIILEAKDHLDNLSRGIEALMFAIYYSIAPPTPASTFPLLLPTSRLTTSRRRYVSHVNGLHWRTW